MFEHILVIGWMFTAGFVPMDQSAFTAYSEDTQVYRYDVQNSTHVSMELNALFIDRINLRGSIDSWQYPKQIDDWTPYRIRYDIGADLSLFKFNDRKFNIILSVDRNCSHPVSTWNITHGCVNTAYSEISIKFTGTSDIF